MTIKRLQVCNDFSMEMCKWTDCPDNLTILRSALDLLTHLRMYCWPELSLSLLRLLSLLAMAGLGLPQHFHVVTLTAVERVEWYERSTRSTQ